MTKQTIIPPYIEENIEQNVPEARKARARRARFLSDNARARRVAQAVEPGHGERREIRDAQGQEVTDAPVVRREDEPDTDDPAVDTSYDACGQTYDYLYDRHQRPGPDGAAGTMIVVVRYGERYDNAFWDGTVLALGEGDIFPAFWKSPSVVAHELGHCFTERTCRLGYGNNEAGGNNEHGSDWFAAVIEQWVRGQSAQDADWLIGRELFSEGLRGRALRDMLHPGTAYDDPLLGKDPQPRTYDQFRPGMDPHLGSAIGNLAFATAARAAGGATWEAIGPIWYDCWVNRMNSKTGFGSLATATVESAAAKFGPGSAQVHAVEAGWDAAKVPLASPAPDPEPASDCIEEFQAVLSGSARHLNGLGKYLNLATLPGLLLDPEAVEHLRALARADGTRRLLARARLRRM